MRFQRTCWQQIEAREQVGQMPEVQTRLIGTPEALDALLLHLERSGLIVHRRSRRKDGKAKMRQYLLIEVESGDDMNANLEPEDR